MIWIKTNNHIDVKGLFHIQISQTVFVNNTIRMTQHFRNFILGFPCVFQDVSVTIKGRPQRLPPSFLFQANL